MPTKSRKNGTARRRDKAVQQAARAAAKEAAEVPDFATEPGQDAEQSANGAHGANGHVPRRRATAHSMAASQRDISVSEFFAKNRHLLGFDNPRKALLTTIKEAVDNSIDACEEAGIVPEVWIHVEQTGPNRFRWECKTTARAFSRSKSHSSLASYCTGRNSIACA
jgi:DNA topoisomerase-6 subunit B